MNNLGFRIDDKIKVHGGAYKIKGIDSYSLENLYGDFRYWKSFTLMSAKSKKWLVKGIGKELILWESSDKDSLDNFKDYKISFEFSGIANIEFKGDHGFSTPLAEVIILKKGNKFFAIERFFKKVVETYYYKGEIFNMDIENNFGKI